MNSLYVDDVGHAKLQPPVEVREYDTIPLFPADVPLPKSALPGKAGEAGQI